MKKIYSLFFFFILVITSFRTNAQVCSTPGKDGVLSGATTIVNTYYPGTASVAAGANRSISVGASVGSATQIAAGDLVLIIQMQGADLNTAIDNTYGTVTNNVAGTYEYAIATSGITAGAFTVANLVNSYTNANIGAQGQKRFQVIRVPQYLTATLGATLTTPAWNGATGGVVVLDVAGNLNFNAFGINVNGLGFRGGAGRQLNGGTGANTDYRNLSTVNTHGQKGEGLAGTPAYVNNAGTLLNTTVEGYPNGSSARGAPGNAGGGGTDGAADNSENTGGGGGSNGGAGGTGGNAWNDPGVTGGVGARDLATAVTNRIIMGGGGGAGSTNNGSGTPGAGLASSGAAGGGIVLVRAGYVTGTGTINANGGNANNTVTNDGSGGGGAGGSVLISSVSTVLTTITVNANGGTGGTNTGGGGTASHGPGGGGGGGVILSNGTLGGANVNFGAPGTTALNPPTNPAPGNFGATPGLVGEINQTATRPILVTATGGNCVPTAIDVTNGATLANTAAATTIDPLIGYDTDGSIISYRVTSLPPVGQGILYLSNGTTAVTLNQVLPQAQANSLRFDPAATFSGVASFTYTATDNLSVSDATPAVYRIPVNAPPVAQNISSDNLTQSMMNVAGMRRTIPKLNATDSDGTIVSYTITSVPGAGGLYLNNVLQPVNSVILATDLAANTFTYYAPTTGAFTFTYTATDNNGAVSNTATYTLNVGATPTLPVAASIITNEIPNTFGTTSITDLSATGGTIDNYQILASSLPTAAGVLYTGAATLITSLPFDGVYYTLTPAQAADIRFNPTAGYLGTATFNYRASNTTSPNYSATNATYSIPVVAAPAVTNITTAAIDNLATQKPITALTATDADGTLASFSINNLTGTGTLYYNGVAVVANQVYTTTNNRLDGLTYLPNTATATNITFNFTATDNDGIVSNTGTYTIPVEVNAAPVITSNGGGATATIAVGENNQAVTTVEATDANPNTTLIYSIVGGADQTKFSINPSTGVLTFITVPDFELPTDADGNNSYLVNVRVRDSATGGLSDDQSITVNVTNVTAPPLATDNIARNKPAVVSSLENANYPGSAAFDGNTTGTRWSSAFDDPQWIYVDLGAVYNITQINLLWEAAYGRDYQLQVSDDAATWTTIQNVTNNTTSGSYLNYTGLSGSGRYVRMYGTTRGTVYGYSLYEFEVFGTPVNTAPTITSNGSGATAAFSVAENTTTVTTVTAADDDGNTITYTLAGADAGDFTISPTGVLTFNPAPNFEGPADANGDNIYLVTVRATDNGTGALFDEQALTITVTNANEAPVQINNSILTMAEGATGTITTALLQYTDVEQAAAAITYTVTSAVNNGTLFRDVDGDNVVDAGEARVLNGTFTQADINSGFVKYVHNGSETTTASFGFSVADGVGGTVSGQTFTINVTPVNDAPVQVNNTSLTINEAATGTITNTLLQFSDAEQAPAAITYTVTTVAPNGTLFRDVNGNGIVDTGEARGLTTTFNQADINSNYLKYAHNGTETTTGNFNFSVTDGAGSTISNQTFVINVNPVNDPPVQVNNATLTVNEGGTGTIGTTLLQFSDAEQAPTALTYSITTAPVNGTLFRDVNGNNVLNAGEALALNGTYTQDDINNNRLRYVHNGSETTTDSYGFSVTDGAGGTVAGQTYNINITPVNDPPVQISNSPLAVNEGSTGTITNTLLQYIDAEQAATAVIYTVTTAALNGTLFRDANNNNTIDAGETRALNSTFTQADINSSFIKYAHNGSETTTGNFGFSVTDGAGGTVSGQTFIITVTPVNDPPVQVNNSPLAVNEGATGTITNTLLQYTDAEQAATALTYTVTTAAINGTLYRDANNNNIVDAGEARALNSTFTQADINSGFLKYTHNSSETNTGNFGFSVTDGAGSTISNQTFVINVNPVNDPPVQVNNATLTVNEGAAGTIGNTLLQFSDAEQVATALTYTITTATTNGTVFKDANSNNVVDAGETVGLNGTFTQDDINNNRLRYLHNGSETTTDKFNFSISDGAGGTVTTQLFNINVTPVNDPPVQVTNTSLTVNEGAAGTITTTLLQYTDAEQAPTALTYTVTTAAVNGTLYRDANNNNIVDAGEARALNATFTQADINSGFLKYLHNGTETTTGNFNFSVTDGAGSTISNQTFVINVNPVNDPPVQVNNATLTVNEGATGIIASTLLQFSDAEQAPTALIYTITTATTNGTVYKDANGNNVVDTGETVGLNGTFTQDDINNNRLRYAHNGSETTTDKFNFSVADGAGGTVTAQLFNITVTPVNDPPVQVNNSPLAVNEGATGTITNTLLQYTDAEQAATALTYTVTTAALNGTLFRDTDNDNNIDAGEARGLNSTFTQADINSGFVKYTHNGSETTTGSFGFSVRDGIAAPITGRTFIINVTPVNDPPTVQNYIHATILNTANETRLDIPNTIQDNDGTITSFRFSSIPDQTTQGLLRVNGATAMSNFDYVVTAFPTVTFTPVVTNLADVIIPYSVKDNGPPTGGLSSNVANFIIPINGEPVANNQTNNVALANTAGITTLDVLNGTDDGFIRTFRFSALPTTAQGKLYVNNTLANTTAAYDWSANRDKIQFDPALGNTSNVTFTYIVKDDEDAEDASPAVFTIPIQAEDQDGDGIADVNDLDDDNDGISDTLESNGLDPSADDDNDGIADFRDPDYRPITYNSITKVNNYFDKDRDGIINAFDLDSDGDGITDVVEQAADGKVPSSSVYNNTTGRLTSAVNTSGPRIGIPSSSTFANGADLNDFDGDELYNFLDIDADNDGLRDYLEAQATPGQPLRNPIGTDTDQDGIDNAYDGLCGCGSNGMPQDPVVSGVVNSLPDYLDENSDDDLYGDAIEAFDNDSDPSKIVGYSLLDLKDLADKFRAAATLAGNLTAADYYNNDNTADADGDGIPNWLEDDDNDKRLNHLDPNSVNSALYYHDSDNDGWIDLFDQDSYGTMPVVNYAFRSNAIQIPLPAELTLFTANLVKEGVILNWETASETNNAYFEVERSQDGVTFQSIGRVKGAGTTSALSRYSLLDPKPLGGTSYYRLKMVNVKGGFRHSPVVAVKRPVLSRPQLKAYPNPTTGEFSLEVNTLVAEEIQVVITDVTGQVIQTKKMLASRGLNSYNFNITDVRTGTYIIIVRGANVYLVDKVVKY